MKPTLRTGLVFLAILLLLPSCGRTPKKRTATVFAMNTVMNLTVYGSADAIAAAEARIRESERLFSVTDEKSEIFAVNRNGGGEVSAETAVLIAAALTFGARTEGALDITVYPVVRAWGFTTGNHRVPDAAELEELLTSVGYDRVTVSGNTVTLAENTEIDLGSVAKGYTADCLTALLREAGVTSALLNLGGNVQAVGSRPDGKDWRVAVRNPNGKEYVGVLSVSDRAVVTSGGYERYFERNGQIYHHIIDPATGYPAKSGLSSVTVVAESGLLADALSTALYVMGLDRATAHWKEYRDFDAVFIDDEGELYITEGLENVFSAWSSDAKVTVIRP